MYETVFLPTAGTDGSDLAIEHAIELASRYDATLHTLYVIESVQLADTIDEFAETEIYEKLEDAGHRAIDAVVEQAEQAGIDTVETAISQGIPSEEILDYIGGNEIDIVVMGTAGRTGEARQRIGSVTEEVIRGSPVPVVAVNVSEAE